MEADRTQTKSQEALQEVAGYLNFSSGVSDLKFLRSLSEAFREIETRGPPDREAWQALRLELDARVAELRSTSPAFRDTSQIDSVVAVTFDHVLPAYRAHHQDLLYHQSDTELFQPFFLGRVFESVLTQGPPWTDHERIVQAALVQLNDFIGHRPVAVLETEQKIEPYSHERVRPIPVYIEGAGVSTGKYHDLIERTLEILRATDRDLLDAAWFDPDALNELAIDPRAYDFNHPANKRPNYHFGQWDPHHIDSRGRYRRFVLVQTTLDALLDWADRRLGGKRKSRSVEPSPEESLFEAAAVLAGTILMASGTSGSGPDAHDSSTTLANLLPRIAAYRDAFYAQLLERIPGPHGRRLRREAERRHQPLAGVRQHLNQTLAQRRAEQLQNVNLAMLYARLGQRDAATRIARSVASVSARMMCEIQCRLAEARRAIPRGQVDQALNDLNQVVDLVHRAIECGALVDPWNILGFEGNFSLFPAPENSIHDHRVDELLDLMEELFAQFSRAWAGAAAADDADLQDRISRDFFEAAAWFDQYAVPMVSSVKRVFGIESHLAAQLVAGSLSAWHKAGAAAGDVAFWRPHADQFDSHNAYGATIESLLEHSDYSAAMGVLVHWSGRLDRVRLGEGAQGFHSLAVRWLQGLLADGAATTSAAAAGKDMLQQFAIVRKFFDYLEANAEEFWQVPRLALDESGSLLEDDLDDALDELDGIDEFDEEGEGSEDEEEEGNLYSAAYDEVVYRDSTDDGFEGAMLESGATPTNYELEIEAQRIGRRLEFLAAVAQLWAVAATAFTHASEESGQKETLQGWLAQAARQQRGLTELLKSVQRQSLPESSGDADALVEYDRRRVIRESLLERIVGLGVANFDAMRAISAGLSSNDTGPSAVAMPDLLAMPVIAFWRAVVRGDVATARDRWSEFLTTIRGMPLLYIPLPRGADPQRIIAVRALLHLIRDLLRALPRLGMLRETCQLIAAARQMEQDHPVGPGAVSEFDRLFEAGYKSLVECLIEAAPDRAPATGEPAGEGNAAELLRALKQLSESLVPQWLAHNRLLRLSVLERVSADAEWNALVEFIRRYGRELFTQKFLNLGNLRTILHQGVEIWLENLAADPDRVGDLRLLTELGDELPRDKAVQHLTLVIEAVIENYDFYRDYNTTTTQSDKGDMLYTLLDFLRVKARYERAHWNLKPVVMAHDVLLRCGRTVAAQMWRDAMLERSQEAAQSYVDRLKEVEQQHGFRLSSVTQRIEERLVRPLTIDRLKKLAREAAEEALSDQSPVAFPRLEAEVAELAARPTGSGLDLPDWLEALVEEVERATSSAARTDATVDAVASIPWARLTWPEIEQQLAGWETLSLKREDGKS